MACTEQEDTGSLLGVLSSHTRQRNARELSVGWLLATKFRQDWQNSFSIVCHPVKMFGKIH